MSERDRRRADRVPPDPQNTDWENDTYLLELSNNVSAGTDATDPETTTTELQWDARVKAITLGWLDGANGQVGVQIRDENRNTYIPYNTQDLDNAEQYIATNDFSDTFGVEFDMARGDYLVAEFVNSDSTNSHLVNVFVLVERVE